MYQPSSSDLGHDFRSGLHVVITGSGSALIDPERGGASAAVIVDGLILQFDCGRGVMENLTRVGINPADIDHLFFTHLHFDHIASFGYFVISTWIAGRQQTLPIYGPADTREMAEKLVFGGHFVDVRFARGLVATWPEDVPGRPRDEPPIEVRDVGPGIVLQTDAVTVTAVTVPHFQELGVQSLGYRVDCAHGSAVITGDGRPSDAMIELAQGADVLVHECAKPDADMVTGGKLARSKATDTPSGPHTTPTWLGRVAREANVKHLVPTHLGPFRSVPAAFAMSRTYYGDAQPDSDFWADYERRIRAAYHGRVTLAHDGLVISLAE